MALGAKVITPAPPSRHRYGTRNGGHRPPKRKVGLDWEEVEQRATRRRVEEDQAWRRKDSVIRLIASIYADIESAVELQRRMGGATNPLTDDERAAFEASEEMRLDHLRELRLTALFTSRKNRVALRAAAVPRGKRYESVRSARDIVSQMTRNRNRNRRIKLSAVVSTLGWSLVTLCLHSDNFRTRFLDVIDGEDHAIRLEQLQTQKRSILFFAKSRSFKWLDDNPAQRNQDVLIRDVKCLIAREAIPETRQLRSGDEQRARLNISPRISGFPADGLGTDHPHEWELSSDGRLARRLDFTTHPNGRARGQVLPQVNIEQSEILLREHRWPGRANWLLHDEPRHRSAHDDVCEACADPGDPTETGKKWRANCECNVARLKTSLAAEGAYLGDRVELRQINPVLGTGVRALQRFPAESVLAEYVGEIYPPQAPARYGDKTYLFMQARRLLNGRDEIAVQIDPSVKGNWTRYMNHSCNATTNFETLSCGDKRLTCIRVRSKSIHFGDEITVNYGRPYFVGHGLACRCGADNCTLWNADVDKNNKVTLAHAKEQGIAPEWAT